MESDQIPLQTPSAHLANVPRTLFETPLLVRGNTIPKTIQPENVLSPHAGAKHIIPDRVSASVLHFRKARYLKQDI